MMLGGILRLRTWLPLLACSGLLGGCTAFVARQIERPGHLGDRRQIAGLLSTAGFGHEVMRAGDGAPLAYWIGVPRAYRIREKIEERHDADGRFHMQLQWNFGQQDLSRAVPLPARGSVVLLHAWGMEGSTMLPWALKFAAAGYVSVMPDLRGQGDSGGTPGYGPSEARDVAALVRMLRKAGRLPGPLYLLGISYGGSVALFAAPALPEARAVVAMEPYANAADTIRRAPASGLFGHAWLARSITPREVDGAIGRASRRLGVDLQGIDAGAAVARSTQCLLVLRGSRDTLMTAAALRGLGARSPHAQYAQVPGENHLSLPLRTDRLFQPLLDWMQAVPDGPAGACPRFAGTPVPDATASPAARSSR